MSNSDIIRAWKDEDYCSSLSEEQRSQLPDNPAGMVELSDEDMEVVAGGLIISNSEFCFVDIDSAKSFICISNVGGRC